MPDALTQGVASYLRMPDEALAASVVAMRDMGVKVVSRATNKQGERVINATAKDREIEVLLEPLTPRTTRMRVIASNGLLKDSATAQEIMLQTERVLSRG